MSKSRWVEGMKQAELRPEAARAVRVEGKAIAVFADAEGRCLGAVDNRCPHEGYPLATGTVKDGVLTCAWHNWKFRLPDGACQLGGEAVRAYPVRIEDGRVWIDVAEPPRDEVVRAAYASLAEAFDEDDWGHAARTVERLLAAGERITDIIGFGAEWSARHAPYGFDHGLAATADLLAMAELWPDETGVVAIQALHLMVQPHLRRPERSFPAPTPRATVAGYRDQLRALVETENLAEAEALVLGALDADIPLPEVFDWITAVATDHFVDFGHGHIYTVKAEELLTQLEPTYARPIVTSLVTTLVYGTREDTLPYMRAFARRATELDPRLQAVATRAADPGAAFEVQALVTTVLDGTLDQALDAVIESLEAGVAADRIALALGLAAAHRILRFDASIEANDDISEGWLDVTHSMTHADAVRESVLRHPSAEALRGLLHSARFVQHLQPLDRSEGRPEAWSEAAGAVAAIEHPPDARTLAGTVLEDRFTLPIFVAHHIKVAACAGRLAGALTADAAFADRGDLGAPLAAAAALLEAPIVERRMTRRGRIARRLIRDGQMQTKLLGY